MLYRYYVLSQYYYYALTNFIFFYQNLFQQDLNNSKDKKHLCKI